MSWQSYVDDHLMGAELANGGTLTAAAIFGQVRPYAPDTPTSSWELHEARVNADHHHSALAWLRRSQTASPTDPVESHRFTAAHRVELCNN